MDRWKKEHGCRQSWEIHTRTVAELFGCFGTRPPNRVTDSKEKHALAHKQNVAKKSQTGFMAFVGSETQSESGAKICS